MTKSLEAPYTPAPPAQVNDDNPQLSAVVRWVADEFQNIAGGFRREPVAITVLDPGITIPIGTTAVYSLMFDGGETILWDVPGGSFNVPTPGLYTVPQAGAYLLLSSLTIDPFGAGGQNYYAGIRLTMTPVSGAPVVLDKFNGGPDDIQLSVNFSTVFPLLQGTILTWEISAVHQTQSGTVTGNTSASMSRMSA